MPRDDEAGIVLPSYGEERTKSVLLRWCVRRRTRTPSCTGVGGCIPSLSLVKWNGNIRDSTGSQACLSPVLSFFVIVGCSLRPGNKGVRVLQHTTPHRVSQSYTCMPWGGFPDPLTPPPLVCAYRASTAVSSPYCTTLRCRRLTVFRLSQIRSHCWLKVEYRSHLVRPIPRVSAGL